MRRENMFRAVLLGAGVWLLAGCEKQNTEVQVPDGPAALVLDKDGHVTQYLNEKLSESYYSFSELDSMLKQEAAAYNRRNGSDSITVDASYEDETGVHLAIGYNSWKDYTAFNNVEFFYGSMIQAQLEGYLFDVPFKVVEKGVVKGSEVSGSDTMKHMEDMVVIVSEPLQVNVPGKLTFVSAEGTVVDASDKVYTREDSGDDQGSAAAKQPVYIIFEDR